MGAAIFIIFIVVFIALAVFGILQKKRREKAMADLAAQRGWTALGNSPATLGQYLPQYLQGLGQDGFGFRGGFTRTSVDYDMAYQAKVGGNDVVFFQYQYTEYYYDFDPQTGTQQERSETHYFIVLSAALVRTLPTILLLHHSFLSKLATFGEHTGLQSLSLEGDFNQHFDTYITPDSQVEALSLLTPDTMELVANAANGASMQIYGQAITLSFENKVLTPEVIQPVLDQMAKLIANIMSKAESRLQEDAQAVPADTVTNSQPPTVTPAA